MTALLLIERAAALVLCGYPLYVLGRLVAAGALRL